MLGERIKELRTENGLSQEKLAKCLNVTRVAVSKWETGDRQPNIDMLKKIADYFEVSTDFLLGRTDY